MKRAPVIIQALLSWGIFIIFESLLGIFRHTIVEPRWSLLASEVVGLILGVFFACVIAYWFLHKAWFPANRAKLYTIGALWVLFTIAFEFILSVLVMNQPISSLFEAFRIDQGRLLVLGLVALFFIPMAVAQRNEVID